MADLNYVRDIKPFDDDPNDWSDSRIADALNGQTINPITILAARNHFAEVDWWVQNQDQSWSGLFQQILDDVGTPANVSKFLNQIWKAVYGFSVPDVGTTLNYNRNGVLRDPQPSEQWAGFFDWAIAQGYEIETDIPPFYADGGGLKFPEQDATAQEVTDCRTLYESDEATQAERDRLRSQYNQRYNESVAPVLDSSNPTDAAMRAGILEMEANWIDGA